MPATNIKGMRLIDLRGIQFRSGQKRCVANWVSAQRLKVNTRLYRLRMHTWRE